MKPLFDNFKEQSNADWLEKVTKDLKGKDITSLNWILSDNLTLPPFVHQEESLDYNPTFNNNKNTNHWEAGVILPVTTPQKTNAEALSLLMNGANALCFRLKNTPTQEDLSLLLNGINLEWISTHFIVAQESWKQLSERFLAEILAKGENPTKVVCSFEVLGSPISEEKEVKHFRNITKQLPKGYFLSINTTKHFSNKVKIAEALAKTIHQGNQFLVKLNNENIELKEGIHAIQFNISLTDSYFLNIATLRALRLLWQQVVSAWGDNLEVKAPIIVHLDESTHSEDENYNKIKAGAQAMSAVIGGADRLFVYPSDQKTGGTAFSQRIALNVQHIMQLESYMDRVVDPAGGSYYIELITEKLAENAWTLFQEKQK